MPFDVDTVLAAYRGNRAIVARLAGVFTVEVPRQLGELRQALEHGDPSSGSRKAHTLKGALMNFFYPRAVELAESIEKQAEAGDLEGARRVFPELEATVLEMQRALENFSQEPA
ncbi:MAG: Hpt domain-containing protein [Armatimonadetes bacterium]|nr:Hpt domain-containing protein [Armatimonadota bacterium]